MVNEYFTIIAVVVVTREILGFPYRSFKLKWIREYSFVNRLLKQRGEIYIIAFWLSTLWLVVRCYENIF